jgi:hypothetical protein
VKFDKLKVGEVYFTVSRQKMGNTTMRTVAIHPVRVKEIEPDSRSVIASWNGNAPRRYYDRDYSKWREKQPLLVKSGFGQRLATREEIKAAKQAAAASTENGQRGSGT